MAVMKMLMLFISFLYFSISDTKLETVPSISYICCDCVVVLPLMSGVCMGKKFNKKKENMAVPKVGMFLISPNQIDIPTELVDCGCILYSIEVSCSHYVLCLLVHV